MSEKKLSIKKIIFQLFQGALIGLGAVLPGISGGVLCVIFGIYKPIMELLARPFHNFKTHVPKLIPVVIGIGIGFVGIAKILAIVLDKYEAASICVFVGLIAGMLPALFREAGEQGRSKASYISLTLAMIFIFVLLITLKVLSINIMPNFGWYIFCGFCLALSIIAPGMSFSTLLMPLGLFEPFVEGVSSFNFSILIPVGIGGLLTVIALAKIINLLFEKHYSVAFHAIVGIVIAATIMIIPFASFVSGSQAMINIICIALGTVAALLLDRFNSSITQ